MKKACVRITAFLTFLIAVSFMTPHTVQAASKWTRVKMSFSSNRLPQVSSRAKYGKYYYYARCETYSVDMGGGLSAKPVDYYVSTTKTGTGTKIYSNYEANYDLNNESQLEFFTNGKYILQTGTDTSDRSISIYRYTMTGKKKTKLRTFGKGTSSSTGEGYAASCGVTILSVYGDNVYAAYQRSGSGAYVDIVSFSMKNKKKPTVLANSAFYFTTDNPRFIGWSRTGSTTLYDCKKKKSTQIASEQLTYLGTYKGKVYYNRIVKDGLVIYRAASASKKPKKIYTVKKGYNYAYLYGKLIYFQNGYENYYVYNVVTGKSTKSNHDSYWKAYRAEKKFKDRIVYLG